MKHDGCLCCAHLFLRVRDLDFRAFFFFGRDFFLRDRERDVDFPVVMKESSVSQAVDKILCSSNEVVRVEQSSAAAFNPDSTAR